jgi:hypothetical protein
LVNYKKSSHHDERWSSDPRPVKLCMDQSSDPRPVKLCLDQSSDPRPVKLCLDQSSDPRPVKLCLDQSSDPRPVKLCLDQSSGPRPVKLCLDQWIFQILFRYISKINYRIWFRPVNFHFKDWKSLQIPKGLIRSCKSKDR